jgi:hypothetical protein
MGTKIIDSDFGRHNGYSVPEPEFSKLLMKLNFIIL